MSRPIEPLPVDVAQEQWQPHYGVVTNMKRTLARSPIALRALMEWYPMRDEVAKSVGDRPTLIFCHAISAKTDCLICHTFFRRILIDRGENPDEGLKLNEQEEILVDFGRQLVTNSNAVTDEVYSKLRSFLNEDQIVSLTALGALMIATNVFNNAMQVPLDTVLYAYREKEQQEKQ